MCAATLIQSECSEEIVDVQYFTTRGHDASLYFRGEKKGESSALGVRKESVLFAIQEHGDLNAVLSVCITSLCSSTNKRIHYRPWFRFRAVSQPAMIGSPIGQRTIGPALSWLGFGRCRPSL